jgi:hypothetical protein
VGRPLLAALVLAALLPPAAGSLQLLEGDAALTALVPPAFDVAGPRLTPAEAAAAGLPPTIQDGIGPGSALHQTGADGSFLCTAAFLLRDPRTAVYYLSTAGHCLVEDAEDPAPYTGSTDPDKVVRAVEVCVAGCIDNALSLGTYVALERNETYHPIAFAQSGGQGADFGLIELPPDVHDLLRPGMPQWGGPTDVADTVSGDTLVHFGHGTYCCPVTGGFASRTPVDQGRAAVSLGGDGELFQGLGWITGGDSGSGIALAVADGAGALRGTSALGVITHGLEGAGTIFSGTVLQHGLDLAFDATGLRLDLVAEGDPLTAVADPDAAGPGPSILIASPAAGATVRPVSGTVPIEGRADFGGADATVEVSIDDPTFGFDSRLPVTGNSTWEAQWYPGKAVAGQHTLYARLVGADGVLAHDNQTIRLAAAGSSGTGSRTTAGGTGNGTGGGGGPEALGVDVPALPGVAALVALAAVAAVARRRGR